MASLRKIPGSRYWIACITRADGSRTQKSTKQTDRKLAQKMAERFQDMEDLARKGRLTEDQVRKVFNEILERTGQDKISAETMESFFRQWLSSKSNEGTARRYMQSVNHFLKCLGDKAKAPIMSLSHRDIEKFIQMRREQGAAHITGGCTMEPSLTCLCLLGGALAFAVHLHPSRRVGRAVGRS
jgi:chorismate mutase